MKERPIRYSLIPTFYEKQIEEYCDELEKALDKACIELSIQNGKMVDDGISHVRVTKSQWKDYLMRKLETRTERYKERRKQCTK